MKAQTERKLKCVLLKKASVEKLYGVQYQIHGSVRQAKIQTWQKVSEASHLVEWEGEARGLGGPSKNSVSRCSGGCMALCIYQTPRTS